MIGMANMLDNKVVTWKLLGPPTNTQALLELIAALRVSLVTDTSSLSLSLSLPDFHFEIPITFLKACGSRITQSAMHNSEHSLISWTETVPSNIQQWLTLMKNTFTFYTVLISYIIYINKVQFVLKTLILSYTWKWHAMKQSPQHTCLKMAVYSQNMYKHI